MHATNCTYPGAKFTFCSHGEKLPRQDGLPGIQCNRNLSYLVGTSKMGKSKIFKPNLYADFFQNSRYTVDFQI